MIKKKLTKKEVKDSGIAILLIFFLFGFFQKNLFWIFPSIIVILVMMTQPIILKPFAYVWFGFSDRLGQVTNKILMSLIFILAVVPIGVFRRVFFSNSFQANDFKKKKSAFIDRNHLFTKSDIENPY